MDTIFAEATPPGRGGVSVVRISGPRAKEVCEHLVGKIATPRTAYLRQLRDGGDLIDSALALWFEKGRSFTGEEVIELHLHGAPVIYSRLVQALLSYGLRRAEAGEFSKRAFLNGRMDLAEAEGLADLLAAETEAQRKLAVRATDGELGRKIDAMRSQLIRAGAFIEVSIDFADEEVPDEIPTEVFDIINNIKSSLQEMLSSYPATERLREGYTVAIIGPPNAGKSSLLNRIARREVALVTDIAGTTRDIIELPTDLKGLPVTFLDTAGIRESSDIVEAMGVELALKRSLEADIRIYLSENGDFPEPQDSEDVLVRSKSDMNTSAGIAISAVTGEGIENLLEMIYDRLKIRAANSGLVGHKRQAEAMQRALDALDVFEDDGPEFVSEAIRQASHALQTMIGRVGAEDYLDEIFSSFCIGK